MRLELQFFGGRGGAGGRRVESRASQEATTQAESVRPSNPTVTAPATPKPVKSATPKPKVDKATAFNEKLGKMKTTMTHEQFNKKWGGILRSAPEGTRIWLNGRTWENDKSQSIYVRKVSSKEVEVQFGRNDMRNRKIAEFSKLGNMLDNYYVSSARIVPTNGDGKTIEFKRKKKQ